MSRSIFGWDLPPGCTMRQIEEQAGDHIPCAVCGRWPDDCICPECPDCHSVGDPFCYDIGHGSDQPLLQRNEAQIIGERLLAEAIQKEVRESWEGTTIWLEGENDHGKS